jgi:hypothetical protein
MLFQAISLPKLGRRQIPSDPLTGAADTSLRRWWQRVQHRPSRDVCQLL